MLGNLFKPKWLHKDAKVRIQAVQGLAGDSVELIKLIPYGAAHQDGAGGDGVRSNHQVHGPD